MASTPVHLVTQSTLKLRSGQATITATSSGSAQTLGAATTTPASLFTPGLNCQGVILQASKANATVVLVGTSDCQTYELGAGDSLTLSVANINQLLLYNQTGASNKINWVATV